MELGVLLRVQACYDHLNSLIIACRSQMIELTKYHYQIRIGFMVVPFSISAIACSKSFTYIRDQLVCKMKHGVQDYRKVLDQLLNRKLARSVPLNHSWDVLDCVSRETITSCENTGNLHPKAEHLLPYFQEAASPSI